MYTSSLSLLLSLLLLVVVVQCFVCYGHRSIGSLDVLNSSLSGTWTHIESQRERCVYDYSLSIYIYICHDDNDNINNNSDNSSSSSSTTTTIEEDNHRWCSICVSKPPQGTHDQSHIMGTSMLGFVALASESRSREIFRNPPRALEPRQRLEKLESCFIKAALPGLGLQPFPSVHPICITGIRYCLDTDSDILSRRGVFKTAAACQHEGVGAAKTLGKHCAANHYILLCYNT